MEGGREGEPFRYVYHTIHSIDMKCNTQPQLHFSFQDYPTHPFVGKKTQFTKLFSQEWWASLMGS